MPARTRWRINTAAVFNPEFVREAADKFGSQCIVRRGDAKWVEMARPGAGRSLRMAGASPQAST